MINVKDGKMIVHLKEMAFRDSYALQSPPLYSLPLMDFLKICFSPKFDLKIVIEQGNRGPSVCL